MNQPQHGKHTHQVRTFQNDDEAGNRHSREGGNSPFLSFFRILRQGRDDKNKLFLYSQIVVRIMLVLLCLIIFSSPAPAVQPLDETALAPISGIVEQAVMDGRIPGAVVLIGTNEKIIYRRAFGWRSLRPDKTPMTEDVIFDVASLTKVVATTTAVMQLVEKGKLYLDAPAARYWPAFKKNGKGKITLRHLLTHYSGLRVEPKLKPGLQGSPAILQAVISDKPLHPPGQVYSYSDLNFIILGEMVRRASGLSLDRYCALHIFEPLEMKDTLFNPPASLADRIAPTVEREGGLLCGEVSDPISYRMGGVAGHAGVFSTADDLGAFARMMLNSGRAGEKVLLKHATIEMMTMPQSPRGKARFRGFGWDLQAPFAANAEDFSPVGAYNHLGYTGTGLWIDPVTGIFLIVLTNRVHAAGGGNVRELREDIRKQLEKAVGPLSGEYMIKRRPALSPFVTSDKKALSGQPGPVETGIDALEKQKFAPLQGLRVGLVTNHTGCNAAGIRSIDLLHEASGVRLVAVFTPEHGLDGMADAPVPSMKDIRTGLPVYSLYGSNRQPLKEWLEGLDALVFDIQDAGVRFYTYISTLHYAMESAAEKGIPFFVLDRPNPINADVVQGPLSDGIPRSFTSCFSLPVRHGMTVGELARMFNAEDRIGADLRVIRMNGYSRLMWYDETGLAWINPSPNLRSLQAATLYPGVAIVEGTNVSVGRGTPTPFELLGAPWMRSAQLATYLEQRRIPGVQFFAADFTPSSGIFKGRLCSGVRISLTDRKILDSPYLGVELAAALYRLYPEYFKLTATLGMIGSRQVLDDVRAGKDPRAIAASWRDSLEEFQRLRSAYLLY